MEFDVSVPLHDNFGKQLKMTDDDDLDAAIAANRPAARKNCYLRDVLLQGLAHVKMAGNQPEQLTPEEIFKRGMLAKKIREANPMCELNDEELTLLKTKVRETQNPLIAFEVGEILKI